MNTGVTAITVNDVTFLVHEKSYGISSLMIHYTPADASLPNFNEGETWRKATVETSGMSLHDAVAWVYENHNCMTNAEMERMTAHLIPATAISNDEPLEEL
jgi:hypothetical protein